MGVQDLGLGYFLGGPPDKEDSMLRSMLGSPMRNNP